MLSTILSVGAEAGPIDGWNYDQRELVLCRAACQALVKLHADQ